jgi:ABC-type nitrate/sulfonate/bicarbonate transport system substrate-binding protein
MLAVILLAQALTLAVSGPPTSIAYLPIRVAQTEGHFTREGLAVTVRATRGPHEAADALLQGTADLAATTLEAVARRASGEAGAKVRLTFGLTAAPPVALLASLAHPEPVRALPALLRQTVGISAPGPDATWLGAILARARLDARTVRMESRSEPDLQRALERGELVAALIAEPLASQLLADGRVAVLADLRTPQAAAQALDTSTVDAAVFGRADRLPTRETLAAFARALLAAERSIATADAATLANRLPTSITARSDEFLARAAAARALYLAGGAVSSDQARTSLAFIRHRLPLSATARLPSAGDLVIAPPR